MTQRHGAPPPKKSLGQHFLVNTGVVERIAGLSARLIPPQGRLLEIGPGPGALTNGLLQSGLPLRVLEVDPRMVEALQTRFAAQLRSGQLEIIHGDALEVSFTELLAGADAWCVCGNLPYNVGTHIVLRFLEEAPQAQSFCFMLQKEVVQRLRAARLFPDAGKDHGALSLKMAWCTSEVDHFWVKPGSFSPPPKVDSGVLAYRRSPKPLALPTERGGLYDRLAEASQRAFGQRRKMLRSSLPVTAGSRWATLRPEQLSPEQWLELIADLD